MPSSPVLTHLLRSSSGIFTLQIPLPVLVHSSYHFCLYTCAVKHYEGELERSLIFSTTNSPSLLSPLISVLSNSTPPPHSYTNSRNSQCLFSILNPTEASPSTHPSLVLAQDLATFFKHKIEILLFLPSLPPPTLYPFPLFH